MKNLKGRMLLTGALNAGTGLSASVFVFKGSGFVAEANVSAKLLFSGAVLSAFVSGFTPAAPSFPASYD